MGHRSRALHDVTGREDVGRGIPRDVLNALKAVPLFKECSPQELREVASLGTEVEVPAGKVLTSQGQKGREFFLIREGSATCSVDGRDVAKFGPGDYFGEMSLLDGGPRTATVTTTSPVRAHVISQQEFATLIHDVPSVVRKLLKAIGS